MDFSIIQFNIYTIPPLVSSVLFFVLGYFVYRKDRKSTINITFLLICFVTFWWQFSWFILFNTDNLYLVKYLVKIGYMGIIFIPILFFHFIISFLGRIKTFDKYLLYFSYLLGGVFEIFLLFSDYLINGYYKYFWGFYPRGGILHPFYLLLLSILALRIIYLLYANLLKRKSVSSYKYNQIKYLLWGIVFYIFASSDFIVNYGIEFYPFGFLPILIFLAIIGYTIISYRLMDLKFVMRKSLVYIGSLSTIIAIAVGVEYLVTRYFYNLTTWIDVFVLIAAVSAFIPIKNFYYRFANKWFFSSLYDTKEVITNLSNKLRTTLEVKKVYQYITESLFNAFHAKAAGILLYDEKSGDYFATYNNGFKIGHKKRFPGNKEMHDLFVKRNKPIITEEVKTFAYKKYKATIDLMLKYGVEMLIPLNVKDKNVGLIVLSDKESGDMYNNEDLSVLEIVSAQSAIAIENALLYDETRKFADKLKKEIAIATADLQKANEELKKLDEAKSEFMSIASHQLRTPLTVIKGYISMMMEGTFGKVTAEERDSLGKVYESNERLIKLVEDFLNISRIESGRLQFNFEVMQLETVVASVVEELKSSAEKKGLKLIYHQPSKALAQVKIDKDKIRQVVMNLIDNSIKYTKIGSITVDLWQGKQNIHFCVSDTGMGIAKSDMNNLFKKFSRGKGTSVVHTEGTGLGLYVGKQMAKAHHGVIWAESEGKDKGAKFCFVVPIYNEKLKKQNE